MENFLLTSLFHSRDPSTFPVPIIFCYRWMFHWFKISVSLDIFIYLKNSILIWRISFWLASSTLETRFLPPNRHFLGEHHWIRAQGEGAFLKKKDANKIQRKFIYFFVSCFFIWTVRPWIFSSTNWHFKTKYVLAKK